MNQSNVTSYVAQKNKDKIHFISLGCPKNLVDSEMMLGSVMKENYQVTDLPAEAQTIVINTCGFIDEAKAESIQTILDMAGLKEKGNLQKLVVAGCLTQRYKDELVENFPEVDLFIGSGEFQNLTKILKDSYGGSKEKKFFSLPTYLQEDKTPRVNSQKSHVAYLKIAEGCKKRCAFCAIPLIRGNLQSRKIDSVVSEAKLLVAGGVKELIVVSHDYTDYGWDLRKADASATESPYNLLKRLSEESGAQWIRVLYLYPDGIDSDMVQLFKEKDNLVKYFDMPLQHINNEVLKRMNRRMKKVEIEQALQDIKEHVPEAVIRTQVIVGFPGETEEQFQELMEFLREQKFDHVGCFKYSQEQGTKAATYDDQVDQEIINKRFDDVMTQQKVISAEKQKLFLGKVMEVVVEGVSEETDLLLQGRCAHQAPEIDGMIYINSGTADVGEIVKVKITETHDYDLVGEILDS